MEHKTPEVVARYIGNIAEHSPKLIRSVAFSPNQSKMCSAGESMNILVHSVPSLQIQKTIVSGHSKTIRECDYSRKNEYIVVTCSMDNTLRICNIEDETSSVLTGHTGGILTIRILPDGNQAVSGSSDKSVKLWDLEYQKEVLSMEGCQQEVIQVDVHGDGNMVVSGDENNDARLFDLRMSKCIHHFKHTNRVFSVRFHPFSNIFATGTASRTMFLFDSRKLEKYHDFLNIHTYAIRSMSFDPSGKYLLSGCYDKVMKVSDCHNLPKGGGESTIFTLKGEHSSWIYCTRFSSNGNYFASCCGGEKIALWNFPLASVMVKERIHTMDLEERIHFMNTVLLGEDVEEEVEVDEIQSGDSACSCLELRISSLGDGSYSLVFQFFKIFFLL